MFLFLPLLPSPSPDLLNPKLKLPFLLFSSWEAPLVLLVKVPSTLAFLGLKKLSLPLARLVGAASESKSLSTPFTSSLLLSRVGPAMS